MRVGRVGKILAGGSGQAARPLPIRGRSSSDARVPARLPSRCRSLPAEFVLELLENQTIDDALLEVMTSSSPRPAFGSPSTTSASRTAWESLIEFASTVKLDIRETHRRRARRHLLARLGDHDVTLLAEKVETRAEYELCRALGFDAFQGYFFARPELVTTAR